MKNLKKKLLSLCCCLIPLFACGFEVGGIIYQDPSISYYPLLQIESDETVVTGATRGDSIVIPSIVSCSVTVEDEGRIVTLTKSLKVIYINSEVFKNRTDITSVVVPNTVTGIGSRAFEGSGITSVTIGESVSSIGEDVFNNCCDLQTIRWNAINCSAPVSFWTGVESPTAGANNVKQIIIGNKVERIPEYFCSGKSSLNCALEIPNSVCEIAEYAFSGCSGLTSLTLGNSVTTIGRAAFNGCSGLTSKLVLPTTLTNISENAFKGCSSLKDALIIPNSITEIDSHAFEGCSSLTSLSIPNSVSNIGSSAFNGCSGLTGQLSIPNSVTTIGGGAFSGCSGLTGSLTIPNTVLTVGASAFEGCSGFTGALTIGESVQNIGRFAFQNCSKINKLVWNAINCNQSKWVRYPTSGTVIETPFKGLTNIKSITIGSSVTYLPDYLCYDLTGLVGTLTIPESVEEIGSYVFTKCVGLQRVNWNAIHCNVRYPFNGSNDNKFVKLKTFNIGSSVEIIPVGLCCNLSGLTGTMVIPNSVKEIRADAFYNCSGLSGSLVFPNSLTTLGSGAFCGCSGLSGSLNIPNSVTTLENGVFEGCSGLSGSLTIPNSVTSIGVYTFYGCSGLSGQLSLPNSVTTIGEQAFYGCSGFTGSLNIPNSVKTIGRNAFEGCSGFTETLHIPKSVTSLGRSAFSNCNFTCLKWSAVNCSDFEHTYYDGSGHNYPFKGLNNVKTLIIEKGVQLIPAYFCYAMNSIEDELNIPNSVKEIGAYSFYNCSRLTSLNIPSSVTDIMQYAFRGCTGLSAINNYINHPSDVTLDWNVFYNIPKSTCKLYVKKGRVEEYRQAEQWKDFTNILEMENNGDLNNDGFIDVSDVNLIIDMIIGKLPQDISNADLDSNGTIDVSDLNAIVNIILGK